MLTLLTNAKLRRHMPCCAPLLTVVLCLVPIVSAAQSASQAQAPSFTIQANVNRVLVPVVVRDAHGHVIDDLTRDDFHVLDDGKPRTLTSFLTERWKSVAGGRPAGDAVSGTGASPEQLASPRRFLVFLFDDMHLSFEDLVHARQSAERMLADTVTGSNLAAVVSVSGRVHTNLTSDKSMLKEAIERLKPLTLMHTAETDCPSVDYYLSDQIVNQHNEIALQALKQEVFNCSPGLNPQRDQDVAERLAQSAAMRALSLGLQDTQQTLAMIGAVARSMSDLPGQRTLVLISPGFLSLAKESIDKESHVLEQAAESNVTISALDARGVYVGEMDASQHIAGSGQIVQLKTDYYRSSMRQSENIMAELADGTGGTFFHNSNDLDAGFQRLAEFPVCVYLLELSTNDVKQNGSYHRLKIKVDRSGVDVQARHGYFAPKAEKKK